MSENSKLSVEKALDKIRKEAPKSRSELRDEKMEALDAEIKRMRTQRLRLGRQAPKGS